MAAGDHLEIIIPAIQEDLDLFLGFEQAITWAMKKFHPPTMLRERS